MPTKVNLKPNIEVGFSENEISKIGNDPTSIPYTIRNEIFEQKIKDIIEKHPIGSSTRVNREIKRKDGLDSAFRIINEASRTGVQARSASEGRGAKGVPIQALDLAHILGPEVLWSGPKVAGHPPGSMRPGAGGPWAVQAGREPSSGPVGPLNGPASGGCRLRPLYPASALFSPRRAEPSPRKDYIIFYKMSHLGKSAMAAEVSISWILSRRDFRLRG